jgi:hypothetical protein
MSVLLESRKSNWTLFDDWTKPFFSAAGEARTGTIKTTERYMQLSPHYRRDAVESLETSGNTTATRSSESFNNAE